MTFGDPYDLARFVAAQDPVFARVLDELRAARKRTHWMWFVFPQLRGLGRSPMALTFGIASLDEARAYLAHPMLGERLQICTQAVLDCEERSLEQIFGAPDDMKFGSSMTLFALAADEADSPFQRALERFFNGVRDPRTIELLASESDP